MSKEVTFEQAKKIKELGFNNFVTSYYYNDGSFYTDIPSDYNTLVRYNNERYSAPTVSEALDFIREVYQSKGLYASVKFGTGNGAPMYFGEMQDYLHSKYIGTSSYSTYDRAKYDLLDIVLNYLDKGGNYV